MTRLMGVHTTTGPRNGFGSVARAIPTVCVAVNDYGPLTEIDGSKTISIYRSQLWYEPNQFHDAPPGIDRSDFDAVLAADAYEGRIREYISRYPADYYQLTNEIPASSSVDSIVNTIAFELEMVRRLSVDGIKLAVGSLAHDSPFMTDWEKYFPDFLREAMSLGAIYSRHVYGGVGTTFPWLTWGASGSGLTRAQSRILHEIQVLSRAGIKIPLVLTECGTHAGIDRPDNWDAWMSDIKRFDYWLQSLSTAGSYPIWGFAAWTYGRYQNANIQDASSRIESYMLNNAPADKPGKKCRGAPRVDYKREYYVIPQGATASEAIEIFRLGMPKRRTVGYSYDDAGVGDLSEKVCVLFGIPASERQNYIDWYGEHYPYATVEFMDIPGVPSKNPFDGLKIGYSVLSPRTINRGFGVPTSYGYPHEGVDMTGQGDQDIYAGVDGVVVVVRETSSGYGKYVKISFLNNGFTFYRYLTHMSHIYVSEGDVVSVSTPVGLQGSTGNSTGIHLHDTIVAPEGYGEKGYIIPDVIDPSPYYYEWAIPPSQDPTGIIGLHGPADPEISDVVFNEFQALAPSIIKVLSSVDKNNLNRLVHESGNASTWIVRAFLDFGGRAVAPDQFFEWTISDVEQCIDLIPEGKEIHVELHNEPNLTAEGYGASWTDGESFGYWLGEVRDLYEARLGHRSNVNLMFPGLSPIGHSGAHGEQWDSFWNKCHRFTKDYDSIGVHAYWSEAYPMSNAVEHIVIHLGQIYGLPIFVTEASRNDRPQVVDDSVYAHDYYLFASRCSPYVDGITFFVASSINDLFAPESWVVDNSSRGIARELRRIIK